MYFYNSLLFIINILILKIHTQSQKPKGPGISGCTFMGSVNEDCGLPDVKIKDIPEGCTSILNYGVFVDLRYHIFADSCPSTNEKYLAILDEVLKAGKPTYIYYGHSTQHEWTQMLASEDSNGGVNSQDEAKALGAFLDEHPGITGLILLGLENDPTSSSAFPKYSEKLKKYLEVMKTSFPKLEIGIEFSARLLIDQITNPQIPWLDFKIIDPSMDFYIISLICFNDCTTEFIDTGIAPMCSSSTNYTMDNVKSVLEQASIPSEKTYFGFRLNPTSDPNDSLTQCNMTLQKVCLDKEETSGWCSDNQTTLNEKGQFAKENGVGFITSSIDLNDPTNLCKCEKPFASFYALLDGFNGVTSKPCTLFSRV